MEVHQAHLAYAHINYMSNPVYTWAETKLLRPIGLRCLAHLQALSIEVIADADASWRAGILHDMLKVCQSSQ